MQEFNKDIFGGLNSDDEDRATPKGDYRYALNIHTGVSDGGTKGAITNFLGNNIVSVSLPSGTNKVVGSTHDNVTNSIIYLVSNSNNEDQIYVYSEKDQSIALVAKSDFGFPSDKVIHSLNLVDSNKLYWTTGNGEPKKINIEKALDNKPREVNLYFDIDSKNIWSTTDVEYTLDINGGAIVLSGMGAGPSYPVSSNRDEVSERFALYINQDTSMQSVLTASGCGNYIKIIFKDNSLNTTDFTSNHSSKICDWVPENYYLNYNYDVVNQIKASKACQPTYSLGLDGSRQVNLITEKTFQFAVRFIFDDFETTVLSPYSCLAYQETCVPSDLGKNYFIVDFTDPRLNDRNSLCVIKKVDLLVRNGNDGSWRIVESIDQSDFGITQQRYKFYNNGVYTAISTEESFRLYDTVPRESETQEFMKNRLFHGNYLQGFNPVCVDASVDVSYKDRADSPEELFSITGYIKCYGVIDFTETWNGQPLWSSDDLDASADGSTVAFGGINGLNYTKKVMSDFHQYVPRAGFTVYLAGEKYFAKTTQEVYDASVPGWVPTSAVGSLSPSAAGNGVVRGNNTSERNAIRDYMYTFGYRQKFVIENVPKGQYILRVASHQITDTDVVDGTFSWHRTSTNVISCGNTGSGLPYNAPKTTELAVSLTANTDINNIWVADLTYSGVPLNLHLKGKGFVGYAIQGTGNSGIDIINGTRIERAGVSMTQGGYTNSCGFGGHNQELSGEASNFKSNDLGDGQSYTDANGYFWGVVRGFNNIYQIPIVNYEIPTNNNNPSSLHVKHSSVFYDYSGVVYPDTGSFGGPVKKTEGVSEILAVSSNDLCEASVYVETVIKDQTSQEAIPSAKLICKDSEVVNESDSNGVWKIKVFGDTEEYDKNPYTKERKIAIYLSPFIGDCLLDVLFIVPNFTINLLNYHLNCPAPAPNGDTYAFSSSVWDIGIISPHQQGFKRGWDGRFGIIYRDEGSRVGFVNTAEDLQTHINFYTEQNELGVQEKYGVPTLTSRIYHEAPEWATHYQWVRTKNEQLDDYLQWVANDVIYVNCENTGTAVDYANSELCLINYQNMANYATCGAKSFVGISIDDSYRIRFIKDSSGNYFSEYIDLAIVYASANEIMCEKSNLFELKPGDVFEVYRPKLQVENKFYYEFGECFDLIKTPYGMTHDGETQSQFIWMFNDNAQSAAYSTAVGLPPPANPTKVCFTTSQTISPTFSNNEHGFTVGQEIYIIQNKDHINDSYESTHKIIEVIDVYTVVIDVVFGLNTPANPGKMVAPAIGEFDCGDAYYRYRTVLTCTNDDLSIACTTGVGAVSTFIDSNAVSDFYLSVYQSIGRLNIEDQYAREVVSSNQITWSGTIIEDSFINRLNSFEGVDIEDLPEEFGPLSKLQRAENVLLAIAENKSASLYIQEQQIISADGTQNLATTNKVIGTVRPFKNAYGTVNPESVEEYVGNVYWWDLLNGAIVRYTNEGLVALSDIKYADFFADLSKDILSKNLNQYPLTTSVFDPYYSEFIITFGEYDENEPTTVIYSEWESRWTSHSSINCDLMEFVGMRSVAFKDGQLWTQHTNQKRNNFFGVQYFSQVKPIINDNPSNVKVFRAISVESNEAWECPEITIPPNFRYKQGFKTRIKQGRFVNKEGVFYSEIPKDMLSPGFPTQLEALINGRDMRGKVLNILFQNNSEKEVVFFTFGVRSSFSELSNK